METADRKVTVNVYHTTAGQTNRKEIAKTLRRLSKLYRRVPVSECRTKAGPEMRTPPGLPVPQLVFALLPFFWSTGSWQVSI